MGFVANASLIGFAFVDETIVGFIGSQWLRKVSAFSSWSEKIFMSLVFWGPYAGNGCAELGEINVYIFNMSCECRSERFHLSFKIGIPIGYAKLNT